MTDTLKILYVDDEPDIRTIVQFALEDEVGLELKLCASGQEALDLLAHYRPDLILLDVMMPGLDGPSTLQHLRALPGLAHVPVAFVTAKVQAQEVAGLKALGATAVIAKPFDPMSLPDQVRTLWQASVHG
ncbi:MAG: response regulator [Gammaproteobacteria bacterium]|nr:response regulator [Rhodocyclaceae bacterium]MBU3909909.1 response regulator [Gammaproteobacteria bacterium]MBU3988939.1 response regulator [Gammaproteobacteria bacterium]MBU4003512.1 response regulator [Gammaproteobacteria bacterium]MBU4020129.1 response regulator [Gammaproteobacteria bacterium]